MTIVFEEQMTGGQRFRVIDNEEVGLIIMATDYRGEFRQLGTRKEWQPVTLLLADALAAEAPTSLEWGAPHDPVVLLQGPDPQQPEVQLVAVFDQRRGHTRVIVEVPSGRDAQGREIWLSPGPDGEWVRAALGLARTMQQKGWGYEIAAA